MHLIGTNQSYKILTIFQFQSVLPLMSMSLNKEVSFYRKTFMLHLVKLKKSQRNSSSKLHP